VKFYCLIMASGSPRWITVPSFASNLTKTGQKLAYLRICWTDLHQIFIIGSHIVFVLRSCRDVAMVTNYFRGLWQLTSKLNTFTL